MQQAHQSRTLKSEQGVEGNQVLHQPIAPLMTTATITPVFLWETPGPLETSRHLQDVPPLLPVSTYTTLSGLLVVL